MWSFERRHGIRVVVVGGIVACLLGCGFHPLYMSGGSEPDEPGISTELASVSVAPIPDRVGQLLRNDLLFLLAPTVDERTATYRLDVQLIERISELAVERSGFATRANLRLNATFALVDLNKGKAVMNSRARAVSSYNIVNASFSTLTAQNAARERAARSIAEDIRSRVSAYLAGRDAGAPSAPGPGPAPMPSVPGTLETPQPQYGAPK
ncbi:MAG: hypothetical protein JNM75_09140 [Rhodospirillales bacterium]|nr:hypothetical protein [Rhodospirillales bacterium]